jgi:hypothetical protein
MYVVLLSIFNTVPHDYCLESKDVMIIRYKKVVGFSGGGTYLGEAHFWGLCNLQQADKTLNMGSGLYAIGHCISKRIINW